MIRIEDDFEDVLGKASAGLGLSVDALANASGVEPARIESLLAGRLDRDALTAVAPVLGLSPQKLLALAQDDWYPSVTLPEWCRLFNTPFPVPGYEAMTVNSFLVRSGVEAFAVDTGANANALFETVSRLELHLSALLITHTHRDHIAALATIRAAYPEITVYAPDQESVAGAVCLREGSTLSFGGLEVQVRETSGHSPGALSYVIQNADAPLAFVGDSMFCLSMGKAPRAYQQALANNREKLLSLTAETILCPGHGPMTTVADELERNPFF
ncbi:MAG: hydroxyacylglutathione hydrolase [Candidatus Azotimanducaceae bacterium]|jgi:hydroxyacylglutathione hydrolase